MIPPDKNPLSLDSITGLSVEIGGNVNLVQGPGGNVSLKDGNDLWIKASGTWLADARRHSIFVRLDLNEVQQKLKKGNGNFLTCIRDNTELSPSIETSFHAVMPQLVVVHVHSVNALSWAVCRNGREMVAERLGGLDWAWINYERPGFPLCRAIESKMLAQPYPAVLLLGNHGLIVAADSVKEVSALLNNVESRLRPTLQAKTRINVAALERLAESLPAGARLPANKQVHLLAQDDLMLRLATTGALYPDHVVFLGATLPVVQHVETDLLEKALTLKPHCVLIPSVGVVLGRGCSASAEAMLECLTLLIPKLPKRSDLRFLSENEIKELLNWDAEQLRQALNKG